MLKIADNYEQWKLINDCGIKAKYFISNKGKVCNQDGKILKQRIDQYGYFRIALRDKNMKQHTFGVHRLVAKYFISNLNNYPIVNHINGIKTDNRVENLEWCTYSHNNKEAFRLGLNKPNFKGIYGKEHPNSKKVNQYDKQNNLLNVYDSVTEASKKTGICLQSISQNCCKKRKSAGGFKWEYAS